MQGLSAEKRSKIITEYAKLLLNNSGIIEEANNADLDLAKKNSMKLKYNNDIVEYSEDVKILIKEYL